MIEFQGSYLISLFFLSHFMYLCLFFVPLLIFKSFLRW